VRSIIRAGRSATEIIRFFGYPRSTVYDIVAKYTALEQSKVLVCQRGRVTQKNTPRRFPQSLKELDFRWLRAIVAKISIDCWCKRANNASNCRGGLSIQIIHIKDTTDALWGCQDKPSCSPRLPFSPPNSPEFKSLGLLRMKRSWKNHKQVLASQYDVIKDHYWGSIRRHGQRACERFRTENRGRHSS